MAFLTGKEALHTGQKLHSREGGKGIIICRKKVPHAKQFCLYPSSLTFMKDRCRPVLVYFRG